MRPATRTTASRTGVTRLRGSSLNTTKMMTNDAHHEGSPK